MRCARLLASRIMASVYSATGPAFAAAAVETTIPRAQQAGVTWPLTLPPACTIARSAGADASTRSSTGGQPQPVSSTSAVRSEAVAKSLTTPGLTAATVPRRSSAAGEKSRGGRSARMASTVSGRTRGLRDQAVQRAGLAGHERRIVPGHELEQRVHGRAALV